MTGEDFVKLCFEEKEAILKEYFAANSQTEVFIKTQVVAVLKQSDKSK